MRRALLLLGATTCVAVIAASVVFAPASAAQYPSGQRLDEPHAMRPIAALNATLTSATISSPTSSSTPSPTPSPTPAGSTPVERLANVIAAIDADRYQNVLRVYAVASFLNAQAAPPEPPARAVTVASSSQPASEGDFLACVRKRESGGDYTIHELTGASQAAGAYQFLPSTWDAIAAATGRSDLIGVDPADASPADQDAMAQALYAQQGAAPWGGSCG